MNFITEQKFAEAFKIPKIDILFKNFKQKIVAQIRKSSKDLLKNFVNYTIQKQKEFMIKFVKCSENFRKVTLFEENLTQDIFKESKLTYMNSNVPGVRRESSDQTDNTGDKDMPIFQRLSVLPQKNITKLFMQPKRSNSGVGGDTTIEKENKVSAIGEGPGYNKASIRMSKILGTMKNTLTKSSLAFNQNQIYVKNAQSALYQLKADYALLDSCLELCSASGERQLILDTLKLQRRGLFQEELAYMFKDLGDVARTLG